MNFLGGGSPKGVHPKSPEVVCTYTKNPNVLQVVKISLRDGGGGGGGEVGEIPPTPLSMYVCLRIQCCQKDADKFRQLFPFAPPLRPEPELDGLAREAGAEPKMAK